MLPITSTISKRWHCPDQAEVFPNWGTRPVLLGSLTALMCICNGVEKSLLNYGKAGATPPPTGVARSVGTAQRREDLAVIHIVPRLTLTHAIAVVCCAAGEINPFVIHLTVVCHI